MEIDRQITLLDIDLYNALLFPEGGDHHCTSFDNENEFFTEYFVCFLSQVHIARKDFRKTTFNVLDSRTQDSLCVQLLTRRMSIAPPANCRK